MSTENKNNAGENVQLRTIPIRDDFMMKKTNDLLYGYLQVHSYLDKNEVRFCYSECEQYDLITERLGNVFSTSKLRRDMKYLIDTGFVQRGTIIDLYDKEVDALLLSFDTNESVYKFISLDTLKYLVSLNKPHLIKIYAYLLNRDLFYKGKYVFTKKELINVLGVKNPKQRDYKLTELILTTLRDYKLIEYSCFYKKYKGTVMPQMRLHKVLPYHPEEDKDNSEENKDTEEENLDSECKNMKDKTTEVNYKRCLSSEELKRQLGFESDEYW